MFYGQIIKFNVQSSKFNVLSVLGHHTALGAGGVVS